MNDLRPLPPGPVEFDEEGEPVPLPPSGSDLAALIQLLEFGRRKGFEFTGGLRVGTITVQRVRDIRQAERGAKERDLDTMPDIWAQHGAGPEDGG